MYRLSDMIIIKLNTKRGNTTLNILVQVQKHYNDEQTKDKTN